MYFVLLCRHRANSTGPFMWKKVRTEQSVLSVNMKDEVNCSGIFYVHCIIVCILGQFLATYFMRRYG